MVEATSGEQERQAKPHTVCPEPSRAKEKGKRPKTRERQYKKWATSVTGTVDRTASRRKSQARPHDNIESQRTWSPRKSRAHSPESSNRTKCHAHRR